MYQRIKCHNNVENIHLKRWKHVLQNLSDELCSPVNDHSSQKKFDRHELRLSLKQHLPTLRVTRPLDQFPFQSETFPQEPFKHSVLFEYLTNYLSIQLNNTRFFKLPNSILCKYVILRYTGGLRSPNVVKSIRKQD